MRSAAPKDRQDQTQPVCREGCFALVTRVFNHICKKDGEREVRANKENQRNRLHTIFRTIAIFWSTHNMSSRTLSQRIMNKPFRASFLFHNRRRFTAFSLMNEISFDVLYWTVLRRRAIDRMKTELTMVIAKAFAMYATSHSFCDTVMTQKFRLRGFRFRKQFVKILMT